MCLASHFYWTVKALCCSRAWRDEEARQASCFAIIVQQDTLAWLGMGEGNRKADCIEEVGWAE